MHLDSPLRGLVRYDGAPVEAVRLAVRQAFENLVRLCIERGVDLLVIAGDIFDGNWRDYNTGLYFHSQLAQLTRAGIRVVMVRGNHDAASRITRHLRLPEGVVDLATDRAETVLFDDLRVAVHGRGYPQASVRESLLAGYPAPHSGYFNLGLLHTALDGREGHDDYAPCRLEELLAKGYDYWALGHVHSREIVHREPWVVFPGNLQGRHVRESGAKGATLVQVVDNEISLSHHPLDVMRWSQVEIDLSGERDGLVLLEAARHEFHEQINGAHGRALALRLKIRSAPELLTDRAQWINQLRAEATGLEEGLWLERIDFVAVRAGLGDSSNGIDSAPLADLSAAMTALRQNPRNRAELHRQWQALRQVPIEYYSAEGAIDLRDPDELVHLLDDVERILARYLQDSSS